MNGHYNYMKLYSCNFVV